MTEKQRLMQTLFDDNRFVLRNIKFCRQENGSPVSEEDFCGHVNKIIFKIDNGLSAATESFPLDMGRTVDVRDIVAARRR